MGPRKKLRTGSDTDNARRSEPPDAEISQQETPKGQPPLEKPKMGGSGQSASKEGGSQPRQPRITSWGSFASKASPIAQIAKESIAVAGGATSEMCGDGAKQAANTGPGQLLFKGKRRSSKSVPLAASTTMVNVTSSQSEERKRTPDKRVGQDAKGVIPEVSESQASTLVDGGSSRAHSDQIDGPSNAPKGRENQVSQYASSSPPIASTWLGTWFSRSTDANTASGIDKPADPDASKAKDPVEPARKDESQSSMQAQPSKTGPKQSEESPQPTATPKEVALKATEENPKILPNTQRNP